MNITLYSTHCPRCNVLTKKLNSKNIEYVEVNDTKIMEDKGYTILPILVVDNKEMSFKEANDWLNSL